MIIATLRNRLVQVAIVLALMAGAAGVVWALFPWQDSRSQSFTAQSMANLTLIAPEPLFSIAGMAPGDVVYGQAQVTNDNGVPMNVTVGGTADNLDGLGLRDQLVLEIRTTDITTLCNAIGFASGTAHYGPAPGIGGDTEVVFSPTPVVIPGGGYSAKFCLKIEMPADTPSTFAASTTSGELIFHAVE